MASVLYDNGRQGFLDGSIVWKSGGSVLKCALVRGYTFSAAHQFYSDVTGAGGTLTADSPAMAPAAVGAGVADAADVTFTAVTAGAPYTAIIVFQSSAVTGGVDVARTAQRLIAYIDTATGLPVTPNGQNITISWDNGANRIFKL